MRRRRQRALLTPSLPLPGAPKKEHWPPCRAANVPFSLLCKILKNQIPAVRRLHPPIDSRLGYAADHRAVLLRSQSPLRQRGQRKPSTSLRGSSRATMFSIARSPVTVPGISGFPGMMALRKFGVEVPDGQDSSFRGGSSAQERAAGNTGSMARNPIPPPRTEREGH